MNNSDSVKIFAVRVEGQEWREVISLNDAGPEDGVFAVDLSRGQVVFGDGVHGRRPSGGAAVTVTYRGAGAAEDAQVSITARWPPKDSAYLVAVSPSGVRVTGGGGGIDSFSGVKRVRYFFGQLLTADDFRQEQQYLIRRRHLHNLALHGSGVVTGMSVTVSGSTSSPSIVVEPGLALDQHGREIELGAPVTVQLGNPGPSYYVVIEYAERETDPVPVPPEGTLMASRIDEGATVRLSHEAPVGDGIVLARLQSDSTVWKIDSEFKPYKCR